MACIRATSPQGSFMHFTYNTHTIAPSRAVFTSPTRYMLRAYIAHYCKSHGLPVPARFPVTVPVAVAPQLAAWLARLGWRRW